MKKFEDYIADLPKEFMDKLNELKTLRERPDYHPEESTYEHIKIVTNRAIRFGDINLILSGILHDIHKLDTMSINPKNGFPTSPGHDSWIRSTISKNTEIQNYITEMGGDVDTVAEICGEHMRIKQFKLMRLSKKEKLLQLDNFKPLVIFTLFDNMLLTDDEVIELSDIYNRIDNVNILSLLLLK